MKNLSISIAVGSCVLLSSAAIAKNEPMRLAPSSKWQVNYDDTRCRLAREFGEGDQKSLMIFQRIGLSKNFHMSFAGKPFRLTRSTNEIKMQFGAYERQQEITFLKGETDGKPAIIQTGTARIAPLTEAEQSQLDDASYDSDFTVEPVSAAREAAAAYISFNKGLRKDVILETGSMGPAFAAMDLCVDNLIESWGFVPSSQKSLSKFPRPASDPGKWVKSDDYPKDMIVAGQPALVDFRVNVDASGKPTNCYIQSTTRAKEFDDAVCKSILKRAEFTPGLDKEGQPIESFYLNRVRFQIGSNF